MMEALFLALALFYIYSVLGWAAESLYCSFFQRRWINRGFLAGPVCPIYGFGAVFVLVLLQPLQPWPIWVFLLGMVITSVLEYATSVILEKLFHTRWWDYSRFRLNLNGRICLLNSTLFGLLCLVVVYGIQPLLMKALNAVSEPVLIASTLLFTVLFVIDLIRTVSALLRRNKEFAELQEYAQQLRSVVRGLGQIPENVPFYEYVQQLMDSTDVDERMAEVVEQMLQRLELTPPRMEKFRSRLNRAFPYQINRQFSSDFREWLDQARTRTRKALSETKEVLNDKINRKS